MRTSQLAIDQIKIFEGYKNKAYLDPTDKPTIGYGHTLNVKMGMTCTPEIAEGWLKDDITPCELAIERLIHIPLTQGQFDACSDFAFNLGIGKFAGSTLIILIKKGDMHGASLEFPKWDLVGGKISDWQVKRRSWDQKRFLGLI